MNTPDLPDLFPLRTYRLDIRDPNGRWRTRWTNMTLRRALVHYGLTPSLPGWRKRVVRESDGKILFTEPRKR